VRHLEQSNFEVDEDGQAQVETRRPDASAGRTAQSRIRLPAASKWPTKVRSPSLAGGSPPVSTNEAATRSAVAAR